MAQLFTFLVSIVLQDNEPENTAQDILDNLGNDDFDSPAEFGLCIRDYDGGEHIALPDPDSTDEAIQAWNDLAEQAAAQNGRDFIRCSSLN